MLATNNAYMMVLLVDGDDNVLSAWTADRKQIADYIRDTDAGDWSEDSWPIGEDAYSAPRAISDYGDEVGRDGKVSCPKARRQLDIADGVA